VDGFDQIVYLLAKLSEDTKFITAKSPDIYNAFHDLYEDFNVLDYRWYQRGHYWYSDSMATDLINIESCEYFNTVWSNPIKYVLNKEALLNSLNKYDKNEVLDKAANALRPKIMCI